MKKILIVSYVFPPAGGITVQRALSFAKYLPANGFEVHVLTAGNAAVPVLDPGLLKHIPPEVRVHRSFTPELPYYLRKKIWSLLAPRPSSPQAPKESASPATPGLRSRIMAGIKQRFSPDPEIVWVPFALRRARKIVRQYGVEYVLVTAPPFSSFLIGCGLKREFPQIKFISDFRDEWLRFYLTEFEFLKTPGTRRKAETIERETVERSDLVVAVTASSLNEIRSRYPEQPDSKFALVSNGYDPEAFRDFRPRPHGTGKIVVTHAGTVYKSSSPRYYLDALDALPEEIRARFETRFVGRITPEEQPFLENRKSEIKLLGNVPQAQALRYMEETDYLLLTMTNDYSLPGKLFEYLATGKRILAFSPAGGEADRILKETGAGWCAECEDKSMARRMLLEASEPCMIEPDHKRISEYSRVGLVTLFSAILQQRLEQPSRAGLAHAGVS